MSTSIMENPNSKAKLLERFQAGRITWKWPLIILFGRLVLAVAAQALAAGVFALLGDPNPWKAAAPWWIVYGTLIDVGCFILLARLAKREGIRLSDLINFQRDRLGKDLLLGVGFIVLFTILAIAGGIVSGILIYGTATPPAIMVPLPLWGTLYSLVVWPLLWAFAEEMTYQGYALPRLKILTGRSWLAVILVGFGWALQHVALPFVADWRFMLFRFASSLLIGIVLPIIYLRTRRLLPFIIGHWAANLVSVLMTVALPLMAQ
jgi:membrane protease YdiL (CAAX protease family)